MTEFLIQYKEYIYNLLIFIGIYLILAQSFNLSFGVGGLFNLAHVASYAVGAYVTALLSTELEMSVIPCMISSMLLSGLFAFLLGGIAVKLSEDYFAIGTLAFSAVVTALLINWRSLTRGVLGIPGVPRPEIFGIDFYQNGNFLVLTYVCVLFTYTILWFLFYNSFGRMLRAQADFEEGAKAVGVPTVQVRTWSFFFASSFAGLAGSLFAYYLNYIDPTSFSLVEMIFVLTIVVVGKPGSFFGCIASTVFLVLLPEPLRFIELDPGILGPMRQLLYALILFIVVFINRATLLPVRRTI